MSSSLLPSLVSPSLPFFFPCKPLSFALILLSPVVLILRTGEIPYHMLYFTHTHIHSTTDILYWSAACLSELTYLVHSKGSRCGSVSEHLTSICNAEFGLYHHKGKEIYLTDILHIQIQDKYEIYLKLSDSQVGEYTIVTQKIC